MDKKIRPVDWESTAVADGTIDLTALVTGWGDELNSRCSESYKVSRWPSGPPKDFDIRKDAATVYLFLRWIGERPEVSLEEESIARDAAERLDLI